jgi:Uma2 family endonuclease
MTAEEYYEIMVEGDRTQLVDGELVANDPRLEHVPPQNNLLVELTNWARAAPGRGAALPPTDVIIDEYNVFGPDVIWLREERVPEPVRGNLKGLPDLAIEVRSPSTWRYDVGKKKLAYERAGLPELWLVDNLAESLLVFRRSHQDSQAFDVELELSGADKLTSPLLPDFSVQVERLFRR